MLLFARRSILSVSADIETIGDILLKIIPTLEEVRSELGRYMETVEIQIACVNNTYITDVG